MSVEQVFTEYALAFEQTYEDDNWQRLEKYFARDAVYEVLNMPFHCELQGRDQIFKGIQKSLNGFDRQCERSLPGPLVFKAEADKMLVFAEVRYSREGSSTESTLWEIATIREGVIQRLVDIYSPGDGERYERWVEGIGGGICAGYC